MRSESQKVDQANGFLLEKELDQKVQRQLGLAFSASIETVVHPSRSFTMVHLSKYLHTRVCFLRGKHFLLSKYSCRSACFLRGKHFLLSEYSRG